jgi:putative ABC transport system permease protein
MDQLDRLLRLGARSLRRAPGFSLTAILTLALGIGLSTAVFTVAEALLLRRLPVAGQERIVMLSGQAADGGIANYPLSLDDAREFARTSRTLSSVAFTGYEGAAPVAVRDEGALSRLRRSNVSGNYFAMLGAEPVLGRALRPEDDVRGAAPVLVLSHRAWQQRYGGSPDVVGRRLTMHGDGTTYTIVGVMPRGLDWPRGSDAWAALLPAVRPENERYVALHVLGRVAGDASPAAARDEMTAFFRREGGSPALARLTGSVQALPDLVLGDVRTAVLVFAAASALLLVITCINVANLLLVRGLARVREVAVRSALGASRAAVVAQLLVEHALLAVAGGALGVLVARWAVAAFVRFAPAGLPRIDEIHPDSTILLVAMGITALAMLLFALAPAVASSRADPNALLRSGARGSAGRRSRRASEALVVGQVALALLVLSAAALLVRSFVQLQRSDLAFDPSRLLVAELALRTDLLDTPAKQRAALEQLLPALASLPGVRAVSPTVAVPFSGTHGWDGKPAVEGQTREQWQANPMLNMEVVTPSWFATFGVPILRGRAFTDEDRQGAPAVVMISQSTAQHFWPDADPIGRTMMMGLGLDAPSFTVAGVVPDLRYRDLRVPRASLYFPLAQSFFPFVPTTLVVRTSAAPESVSPAISRLLDEGVAPGIALVSASPFADFMDGPLAQSRLNALLLAAFAAAALVLAAVGLFGVMATMVRQRTRELGVRMALGATSAEVARLVLRRGVSLAAIGTAAGLIGALGANRLLSALLYEVSPTDAATLATVATGLLVVAVLAIVLPARASARIAPAEALRSDLGGGARRSSRAYGASPARSSARSLSATRPASPCSVACSIGTSTWRSSGMPGAERSSATSSQSTFRASRSTMRSSTFPTGRPSALRTFQPRTSG